MEPRDDKQLYGKLKGGDELAFKALFQKYYASLCHFAFQFLPDRQLAEEMVQEFFVHLWEKRRELTIESSVKQYFFRSVKNQCLNQLQRQKIKNRYAGKMMEAAQQEPDPEQYYMEVDLIQRIEKALESLPPKRQEIFRLSREKDLTYKEIAEELNLSVKTVEAQMGLSLKHLRDELKDFNNYLLSLLFVFRK